MQPTINNKMTTSQARMKSNSEVPIFLRKTYHMIDTCDTTIASWSEDGETFIVKQPETFSSKIIPQFFKHSKFSSFVRQLNFYGFRKIKFSDSIKIDEKLERETKDYWRFRHECFRKGREDLLAGIKRSNSNQTERKGTAAPAKSTATAPNSKKEVNELKEELNTLKDRIAKMTNNIDTLTSLVHNVTLEEKKIKTEENVPVGAKRKKMDETATINSAPQSTPTNTSAMEIDPCVVGSGAFPLAANNDISNIAFTPSNIFPAGPLLRENSENSNISDVAFVDELFSALDSSDMEMLPDPITSDIVPEMVESSSVTFTQDVPVTPPDSPQQDFGQSCQQHPNSPDPALMNELSDALTVLPKDMQELLVNRLIATITSSEALKVHLDSITKPNATETPEATPPKKHLLPSGTALENNPEVALPLAAATLAALMTQFSATIKNKSCVPNSKSLPVIPIHA